MGMKKMKLTAQKVYELYVSLYGESGPGGARVGGVVTRGGSLPPALSLQLGRIGKLLEHDFQNFDQHRVNLIKEHGFKDEDGSFSIPKASKEAQEAFYKAYGELAAQEIEIELPTIPFRYFESEAVPTDAQFRSVSDALIDLIEFQ